MPVTPRTFHIQTLGCRTNGADSDRIATFLTRRGLQPVATADHADLRILNSCSVTTPAAAQSRQSARKLASLPVLQASPDPQQPLSPNARVIVTGCWATSNPDEARTIPGVDAVITHRDHLETRLSQCLTDWGVSDQPARFPLPQWGHSPSRQRAYLKVQDGCDAHCTYCIIPKLRSNLWSIDPADAVAEIRQLVASGHREVVLTGIFLGATGQTTALRRRQTHPGGHYLAELLRRIASDVPELPRLRLSSLEPGDLTDDLLEALLASTQIVPHFHLPLQSGSDAVLHRMNRQYTRQEFLDLVDRLHSAFDRPALTTDILTGFPGESESDFDYTLAVVDHARFLHVHAFPFSPRPGTAAARWTKDFVPGHLANQRARQLRDRTTAHALEFRRSFVGQKATVIIESSLSDSGRPHGRCERYFDIELDLPTGTPRPLPGTLLDVRITSVTPETTLSVPT
jgi:threonylcarbamoyladenosine tRNA methylthiotransferase MtaB